MKKILPMMICIIIILSIIFTGCGNNPVKSTSSRQQVEQVDSIISDPGVFPIVKEGNKIILTMTAASNAIVDNFEDNEFTKWFEEKTGVDFEFNVLPSSDAKQKLNLMMSSGDYTDVIMDGNFSLFTLAEQQLYASQGILLPLDDMIEKYGIEVKKTFKEYADSGYDIKDMYTLLDNKIYTLPSLSECYHCQVSGKMWVYKPWLDKLGLKMPTTTEEFYNTLKAFKEKDPNGNKKQDEIPLAGTTKGWRSNIDIFLMNAFIRNDGLNRLILNDGKIDVAYNKSEWKEGLQYLKRLFDEGLIAPESFTQNKDQLNLLAENAEVQILGAAPGGIMPGQVMGESGRWKEYKAVPALKGPDGVQEVALFPSLGSCSAYFITDKCKYPEVAFRVGDAFFNDEIYARADFGRKDKEWRWAKEGELGINGEQGVFKQIVSIEEMPKNITWYQKIPGKQTLKFRLGRVIDNNPLEKILYEESRDKYYPYAADINSTTVPNLIFSEEDATELVDIESNLNEYVNEMIARFITGDVDLETGWEKYLDELEAMNLSRYVSIYQNAYDSKFKK